MGGAVSRWQSAGELVALRTYHCDEEECLVRRWDAEGMSGEEGDPGDGWMLESSCRPRWRKEARVERSGVRENGGFIDSESCWSGEPELFEFQTR